MLILETERLIVRQWTQADEEPFHAICSDPLVMRHVGDGAPWSRDRTRQFLEDAATTQRESGYCRWPLTLRNGGHLGGFCGFVPAEGGAEMGWRLASPCWGRGLATEAARAVLTYGLQTLRFPRVLATIQAGNEASVRVAKKLGMACETRIERNGRDILIYVAEGTGTAVP